MVQHRARAADRAKGSGLRARGHAGYALRQGALEHRLTQSPLILGRGAGADLVLPGPHVSRRHAELTECLDGLIVTDLSSQNGVFVNGQRIWRPTRLELGDTLALADHTFVLVAVHDVPLRQHPSHARARPPREPEQIPIGSNGSEEGAVAEGRADAMELLGSVVDKVLASGAGEEAEHLIGSHLVARLSDAAAGRRVAPEVARATARYAVKLGAVTSKPGWLDFVFRLYLALGRTLPLPIVDEMYIVLRRVPGLDRELLRDYAEQQRLREDLSAPERFVLQRLEGLERLAGWHPPG